MIFTRINQILYQRKFEIGINYIFLYLYIFISCELKIIIIEIYNISKCFFREKRVV